MKPDLVKPDPGKQGLECQQIVPRQPLFALRYLELLLGQIVHSWSSVHCLRESTDSTSSRLLAVVRLGALRLVFATLAAGLLALEMLTVGLLAVETLVVGR